MHPLQVCCALLLIFSHLTLLFYIVTRESDGSLTKAEPGPVPGSLRLPKTRRGLLFDLKEAYFGESIHFPSEDNFYVEGFKFYEELPLSAKKIVKSFNPTNFFLLKGKSTVGKISLKEVEREQASLVGVLVVVTYLTTWDMGITSSLTVIGRALNRETNEMEEESEVLPEIPVGENKTWEGYCQKIIYFGPVDEVIVIGSTTNRSDSIVVIDTIKVVVGSSQFDLMPHFICPLLIQK